MSGSKLWKADQIKELGIVDGKSKALYGSYDTRFSKTDTHRN